jgi:hypothetical protein
VVLQTLLGQLGLIFGRVVDRLALLCDGEVFRLEQRFECRRRLFMFGR